MIKPDYYKNKSGKDLFDLMEAGLLPEEQVRGFYKGNAIKYIVRYQDKNGVEDIDKSITYLSQLKVFESKLDTIKRNETVDEPKRVVIRGGEN